MEIELKLLVAPEHLAWLEQHPALTQVMRRRLRKQPLRTVYFDTPDFDLAQAGVALRLRQEGSQWTQTLKGNGSSAGGLHVRDELEWKLPNSSPDLVVLDSTPYRDLFARSGVSGRLTPVFTTEFDRAARVLAFPDGTAAELAIDRGAIRAGNRRVPISEVELELKSGDPQRLFELAREIARDVPVHVGHASKAERGYALARGAAPAPPQKARSILLAESLTAGAALSKIAVACVVQMQANEEGVIAGRDPEYLHQFRVGLRRLRSALGLIRLTVGREWERPLAKRLRWLQNALGPARDWDVFVDDTLRKIEREQGEVRGRASFRARCARLRRMHMEEARVALRSPRYTAICLALGQRFGCERDLQEPALQAPVADFAAFVLDKCDRGLRKYGGDLAQATPERRHAARIAAKKLRYASEFFASLYPRERVAPYVDALERLQDILGAMNDAATVGRLLGEIAATAKRGVAPQVDNVVRSEVAARAARELVGYGAAWRKFEKLNPFWQ